MKELPGGVYVSPQILPQQINELAKHGVVTIINNRPDMEVPEQPLSVAIQAAAAGLEINYTFIPMARPLTSELIEAAVKAYKNLPRPIFAYCASGTRSTILWCFAHAEELGVDAVLDGAAKEGYDLEQYRGALEEYIASRT